MSGKRCGECLVMFDGKQVHRLFVTSVGARVGMLVPGQPLMADQAGAGEGFLGDRTAAALSRQEADLAPEQAIDDDRSDHGHSQAAPRTPDESP